MTAPLDVSPVVGLGHQQAVRKESSTEKRSDVFKQRPTPRTSAAGAVKRVGRYLGAIRNLSKKKAVEHDSGDDGESYGHQSTIDGPQIHADEAQRSLLRVDLDGSLTNNRSHVSQVGHCDIRLQDLVSYNRSCDDTTHSILPAKCLSAVADCESIYDHSRDVESKVRVKTWGREAYNYPKLGR